MSVRDEQAAEVLEEQGYAAWLRELARREDVSRPAPGVEISPCVDGLAA